MAKVIERHTINDNISLYKQDNSKRWYSRFKIHDTWYTKATKEKDLDKAIVKGIQLQTEFTIMLDNKIPVHKSRKVKKYSFNAVAELAITRMEDALKNDTGKMIYKSYIGSINKYLKPFFGDNSIKTVDAQTLLKFDDWRIKTMKRQPSKSTVQDHNSALQRVLDEAVIHKYLTQSEMPVLKNTGHSGERRAGFTKNEYEILVKKSKAWIKEGKKEITKTIRQLLHYYIQIAALTGMRPGKEIDQLTWNDIHTRIINGKRYTTITVKKGKTTKFTGTREIVCKDDIVAVLNTLRKFQNKPENNDLIFTVDVSSSSNVFGKNFTRLLKKEKMQSNAHGVRSLYSLRHSYITWELENGTELTVIATQCGTSEEMIEQHYKHVLPSMFAEQLSGKQANMDDLSKLIQNDDTSTLVIKDGVITVEY